MQQKSSKNIKEIGQIYSYFYGVAKIQGLPHVSLHEILLDEHGKDVALVIGFDRDFVEALFFKESFDYRLPVFRSGKSFTINTSRFLVGKVLNGIGLLYDSGVEPPGTKRHVFSSAPSIIDRKPIDTPLTTGIKVIDTTLPLGKGQRELIIGDRKLGKSTMALDIVINQKNADPPIICIYVVCGQKNRQLSDIISIFEQNNTFFYTTIVAATADDSFAAQFLAPFVGCTIGEFFRDKGKHVLIVYDDLSKHANVYRDIALLLERVPGREAYPGDIFSLHAQLLERSANLNDRNGAGSLTAIPIAETQEGDISSFIPTNLISITDGQIYLERGLFQRKFLPAVNVGLSVSRVGSRAQPPLLKNVVESIRLALAQHKELQKLTQLETTISQETRNKIHRGELILELLKQDKRTNVNWQEQVVLFYIVESGFFDDINRKDWHEFEHFLLELMRNKFTHLMHELKNGRFDDEVKEQIKDIVKNFKKEFLAR